MFLKVKNDVVFDTTYDSTVHHKSTAVFKNFILLLLILELRQATWQSNAELIKR